MSRAACACSASCFGKLVGRRQPKLAEQAFKDSLGWHEDPNHRAQVWHSLGNHLSGDRSRFAEAEKAFRKSLDLDPDPRGRAQVLASWAEAMLRDLRRNPSSQTDEVIAEAEAHAREALRLDPRGARTRAAASLALADVHEIRGELEEAVALLEEIVASDRKRGYTRFIPQNESRIFDLKQRLRAKRSD